MRDYWHGNAGFVQTAKTTDEKQRMTICFEFLFVTSKYTDGNIT
jgi:hypothetical protein